MTTNNHEAHKPQSSDHAGRHIALLIKSMRYGGGQTINLACGLAARGYKIDLLLRQATGVLRCALPSSIRVFVLRPPIWISVWYRLFKVNSGIPLFRQVHYFGLHWISRRIAWLRVMIAWKGPRHSLSVLSQPLAVMGIGIAEYLTHERPDVLVASSFPNTGAGALLTKELVQSQTQIVVIFRRMMSTRKKKCHVALARLLLPKADDIVAVSYGLAKHIITETQIAKQRITTIYNPAITPHREAQAKEIPDHPWMHQSDTPVILACGSLVPVKDFRTLLRAFAQLTHKHTRLVILGEGKQETSLKALTCDLGLEERVSFPGWCYNPLAFMSYARLFVLSSRSEGFGNVLVEAMMCGCPVVSTDCPGGPREILEDGRWGELVPVGDDQALAQAIDRALSHEPDREGLRSRAQFFSVDRAVDQYEKLFRHHAMRREL